MKRLYYALLLTALQTVTVFGQQSSLKDSIHYYLEEDNFFKAQELFATERKSLDKASDIYIGLTLENAFNRNQESQKLVNQAIKKIKDYPDKAQKVVEAFMKMKKFDIETLKNV